MSEPMNDTSLSPLAAIRCYNLRTERDQARADLANIRRALELTGTVLPEIDEDTYEYSAVGEEKLGEWPDLWAEGWVPRERRYDMSSALLRRRHKIRRPPTDADAIDQPRSPCWVLIGGQWVEAQLLLVADGNRDPYLVVTGTGSSAGWHQQCEIEVEA